MLLILMRGRTFPRSCGRNIYARFASSRAGIDDYEKERALFAAQNITIPPKFNFASNVIDVWAHKEKIGERTSSIPAFWFVSDDGRELKWSFQELKRETKRTANMLNRSCGIGRGDSVFLMLPKIPEYWLVNIAAMRLGIVLCLASIQLTAVDLAYRLAEFQPSSIIAHESVAGVIDEVADSCASLKTKILVSSEENSRERKYWLSFHSMLKTADSVHKCVDTDSDETSFVFFTSGSTGNPKMVEHSYGSYGIGHEYTGKYYLDLTSEKIVWNLSDTGWGKTAYSSIYGAWWRGACVFVHEMSSYNSVLALNTLSQYPIDTFCAPPMAFKMMVQEDLKSYKFCKLSHCVTGGESLSIEVSKKWEATTGFPIYCGYGQTETVMLTAMLKCFKYKYGSIGKPFPAFDLAIVDVNENEMGPGVEGEIVIKKRGERILGLFKGYRNKPELIQSRLTEKYFHTGDLGYRDEDGYYYFVGRNDDLINTAGYRVGPFEVESALMEHPAVEEAAAVSSPDGKRGEVIKAFIVLKANFASQPEADLVKQLQEHAKRITAPYKYPRKIEFVKELPKTTSGKIKRHALKKKEWNL